MASSSLAESLHVPWGTVHPRAYYLIFCCFGSVVRERMVAIAERMSVFFFLHDTLLSLGRV